MVKHPGRRDRHSDAGQYRFAYSLAAVREEIPVNTNVQRPGWTYEAPFVTSMCDTNVRVHDAVVIAEVAWGIHNPFSLR